MFIFGAAAYHPRKERLFIHYNLPYSQTLRIPPAMAVALVCGLKAENVSKNREERKHTSYVTETLALSS